MTREVVPDFETYSACDLKKSGSRRYAEDPTTDVICLCFEDPDRPGVILTWHPGLGPDHLVSRCLLALALDPEIIFVAHNAGFEKDIWRCIMVPVYGFPDIPNDRWDDTQAVCAYKALPQDLDTVTRILRLPALKDAEAGTGVIALSRPNKKTGMLPAQTPEVLAKAYDYCAGDVRAERALRGRLGSLPPAERKVWLLDQTINERGVRLDMAYVRAAQRIVDMASEPLLEEHREITGLKVSQAVKVKQWVKDQGFFVPDLTKETIAAVLHYDVDEGELDDDDWYQNDPPPNVRRALEIRQLIGSASIKKLARMEACVGADGRARRLLQYHGAGPGRWAGRILQPHNFPRGTLNVGGRTPSPDIVVAAIMSGDPDYIRMILGEPVETVVSGLRHAMIPDPGRLYLSGDYAQIEARIVLALAGQYDKLDIMRAGGSLYTDMGQLIFNRPIDKKKDPAEYQIGKNTVLGLGFGMGAKKFRSRYAKDQPIEFSERVIKLYRDEWAPMVPKVWYALGDAAVRTVWDGAPHEAYGVLYQLEDGWLSARLPSGRKIWYRNPQKTREAMPWDDTDVRASWTYQAMKMGVWKTIKAYGALLTENVVQALARDVLVAGMFRLEANGFPLVLTVHDEALAEPLERQVDEKLFAEVMTEPTAWVKALQVPIAVETWAGQRYKK